MVKGLVKGSGVPTDHLVHAVEVIAAAGEPVLEFRFTNSGEHRGPGEAALAADERRRDAGGPAARPRLGEFNERSLFARPEGRVLFVVVFDILLIRFHACSCSAENKYRK